MQLQLFGQIDPADYDLCVVTEGKTGPCDSVGVPGSSSLLCANQSNYQAENNVFLFAIAWDVVRMVVDPDTESESTHEAGSEADETRGGA